MFLYDLIVYHHLLNRNSFSPLFGGISSEENNAAVIQWVKFVNDYDSYYSTLERDFSELSSLDLEKVERVKQLERRNAETAANESGDPDAIKDLNKKTMPYWLKPNILPLFVNTGRMEEINYHNANILSKLFYDNLIVAKTC